MTSPIDCICTDFLHTIAQVNCEMDLPTPKRAQVASANKLNDRLQKERPQHAPSENYDPKPSEKFSEIIE